MEFVLWATPAGGEDWQEVLITSTTDPEHLRKAKEWAVSHGFTRLRVSKFTPGDMPDFAKTIRF